MSEAVTGASIVVKLPGYDRAWFVSDVKTGVSVVALELLRTASDGCRPIDRNDAEDAKVTSLAYGEGQRKTREMFFVYVGNGFTIL